MNGKERRLTRAIVRPPSTTFSKGLTTVDLGIPDYNVALTQHAAYCAALASCGLNVVALERDDEHPDSTFVEDTAVLTERCAIITRPGAETRRGEITSIETALAPWFDKIERIEVPGTVDGGDVCEAGNHFFIGLSARTNEAGAQQLADLLGNYDYSFEFVDIRNIKGILHLKSGIAHLERNRLVVIDDLASLERFHSYDLIRVHQAEEYAANCLEVNGSLLIAAGFPVVEKELRDRGCRMVALNMSEFQKMDGGLSCLSLRF